MGTHSCRVFLNSCVKVPIDPCNNCPAPIYNRPKMYLGRLTTTPLTASTKFTTAGTSLKATEIKTDAVWACSSIRSLAKLYDSIPDYCDINHLPEEEFYSTLDTLRTTCRVLRSKPSNSSSLEECSSGTYVSSSVAQRIGGKPKHSKKKKSNSAKSGSKKKSSVAINKNQENKPTFSCITDIPCSAEDQHKDIVEQFRPKSYKKDFEDEVKAQKILKDFEKECKQPISVAGIPGQKSVSVTATDKNCIQASKYQEYKEKDSSRTPVKFVPTSARREFLRKSFSFNDISLVSNLQENDSKFDTNKNAVRTTGAETLAFKDRTKLSNYFKEKSSKHENISLSNQELPKIIVEPPNSDSASCMTKFGSASLNRYKGVRSRKAKSKQCQEELKPPFSLFAFEEPNKDALKPSPSPMHPVARPNLAATLRAEVSKQKLKELHNNCTYHDTMQHFDWEVRKTPAWKSLTLNETHKEILALRLATRKAEQALQEREYALNMELMRQRVKTAPLLLEGATYWGPYVGKLTHTCQLDGLKHACDTNQNKERKRTACSSSSNRRRGHASSERASVAAAGSNGRASSKLHTLRKVYANSATSCTRNAHFTSLARRRDAKRKQQLEVTENGNDSGDELSSVDRAYL